MADTQTGLNTCSCQCSPVMLSSLTRLPVMSNIFASGDSYSVGSQTSYLHGAADSSFFCSHLGAPGNNIRDSSDTWRPVTQSPIYDPTSVALYPYRAGYGGLDLNGRRKNATRESTNTLKSWLQEHLKNPYPTKGEKIMLAIITKMTLTQVSTWFANARRRLKKENRISGSPRHRSDNSQDGDLENIFVNGDEENNTKNNKEHSLEEMDTTRTNHNYESVSSEPPPRLPKSTSSQLTATSHKIPSTPAEPQTYITAGQSREEVDSGKRKIWSVIEFLNTTSHDGKDVLELDFVKSDKSRSGDVFHEPVTRYGNPSARRDNHSSSHENSCDNQSSVHVTSYDNQSSKRQPSSSILRPCLSSHETALGYMQENVYARSRHLIERM